MTIKTRASLQSFFQRGDRPTSANFADLTSSFIILNAPGSSLQTGLIEVETTASTTAYTLGALGKRFLSVSTTAQAKEVLAITSASVIGGGEFGGDWLNTNSTAEATSLLGILPVASLPDASAAAQGVIETASSAESLAAADAERALTPAVAKFHPGMAKAWVTFNGASIVINGSHNVDSIVDGGLGIYTVSFDVDFSDANYSYACIARATTNGSNTCLPVVHGTTPPDVDAFAMQIEPTGNGGGGRADSAIIGLAFYGDQ